MDNGWPVLAFENPMSLRNLFTTPSAGIVAVGVTVGAVAAGATWYGLSRRKRER
jgi:hypothetical protein